MRHVEHISITDFSPSPEERNCSKELFGAQKPGSSEKPYVECQGMLV